MKDNVWTKGQDIGPNPRGEATMVYANRRAVLFGGRCASGINADTWEWDGTFWMQRQNMRPRARRGHSMAYDSDRDRIILFGGVEISDNLGDTWELKIDTV